MSSFIVIENFSDPIVVTDETGNAKIFTCLKDANAEAEDCQVGIVVPLDENIIPKFINGIDFTLLKEQKKTLLETINEIDNIPKLEKLEGIISLINAIQDYAVDVLDFNEDLVFDFERDVNTDDGYF